MKKSFEFLVESDDDHESLVDKLLKIKKDEDYEAVATHITALAKALKESKKWRDGKKLSN